MGALLASPIISAVVSVAVAYIAFKVAFFTIKRVAMNAVTGILTYLVCVHILNIPMDIGLGVWGFNSNSRPYSNAHCSRMVRLFKIGGPHAYQS